MDSNIFARSVKDFFSGRFLALSFAPLVVASIVLSIAMFYGVHEVLNIIKDTLDNGGNQETYPILTKVLSYGIVHWLISTFFYVFATFLVVVFSIVIAVLVLAFLTPTVVKTLHSKYYPTLPLAKDTVSIGGSLWVTIFTLIKFILILFVCIPFMFFPVVNIIAFNAPFYYLFHKLIVFDVASNIFDKNSYKKAIEPYGWGIMLTTLCFFILALIPVLGLFLQLFFVIYLTHYIYINIILPPVLAKE